MSSLRSSPIATQIWPITIPNTTQPNLEGNPDTSISTTTEIGIFQQSEEDTENNDSDSIQSLYRQNRLHQHQYSDTDSDCQASNTKQWATRLLYYTSDSEDDENSLPPLIDRNNPMSDNDSDSDNDNDSERDSDSARDRDSESDSENNRDRDRTKGDKEENTYGRRIGRRYRTKEGIGEEVNTNKPKTTRVPRHGVAPTTNKFNIKRIHIPGPLTTGNQDQNTPEVGSAQHQVIASWKALFTRPKKQPSSAKEIPTEPDTKDIQEETRRYRQVKITAAEQDANTPYGDLRRPKTPGYDRLVWCNPNGIRHCRDLLDFKEIIRSLHEADTSLFGLPETNLDWLRPEIRKKCEDCMNEFYGTHILATSTSSLRSNTPYKPGGTCMGLTQELSRRFQSSGSDPHGLGRWSQVHLNGKQGRSATIITTYRVCDAHISSAGASTAYHQQWYLSRMAGEASPNPRKRFIQDLIVEIKKQ
jgi:hypothetical protein